MTLEFRLEPTKKALVIVASKRAKRPRVNEGKKICPFDPGNEYMTPPPTLEFPEKWRVRAMENKFPFLSPKQKFSKGKEVSGGFGIHEVYEKTISRH